LLVVLALAPAALRPREYTDLAQRFFTPWSNAVANSPYRFVVTPGDATTARGRPLTFSVQIQPRSERTKIPTHSELVTVDGQGKEIRKKFEVDAEGAFSYTLEQVPADFQYFVAAGGATSERYQVRAVEPIDLDGENSTIIVAPPAYARETKETETIHGLNDL